MGRPAGLGSAWTQSAVVVLLALGGCSGDGPDDGGRGADGSAEGDAAADGPDAPPGELGADEVTEALPDAPRPASCPADHWLTSLRGAVVDESGRPLEGVKVQLCLRVSETDRLLCLRPADSAADGRWTVVVPDEGRCLSRAVVRVIRPLERLATSYCEVDLTAAAPNLELAEPYVLFATTPATTLPPEGDGAAARTVIFDGGLEVDVVPDRLFLGGDGYAGLAARRVPLESDGLCFVPPELSLDALFAFSPEGDVTGGSLTARLPVDGLPSGTTATLYVLGSLNCTLPDGTLLEEGALHEVGTAAVGAPGEPLEASGEAGLPCFSWWGYRLDR
jgi:hypothetical protein